MSNYTKTTNFAIKDSLTTGDPLKLILGTDLDTEFNNLATAIATKLESSTAALLGSANVFTNGSQAINPPAGNASLQLKLNGTAVLQLGVASAAAQLIADTAQNDVAIINQQSGKAIRLSTDNGSTSCAVFSNALVNLKGTAVQCNGVPFTTVLAIKAGDTSRNTTTTLADDPDLTVAIPGAGKWHFEMHLAMTGQTTTAQGFKWQLVYTGTAPSPINYSVFGSTNGAAVTPTKSNGAFNVNSHGTILADGGAGADTDFDIVRGVIVTTNSGNFKLQWAQANSNANNSNLKAGSYLRVWQAA